MNRGNGQTTTAPAQAGVKQQESFGAITAEKSAELAAVAVASASKAEVEAAYIMALKRPRHEDDARAAIVKVCGNPAFAAKAKYRKPVGKVQDPRTGQWVQHYAVGPSIRFAEEALRHWGNVLVQLTHIYEDDSRRIVKVAVRDLESNIHYSQELTVEKHVERRDGKGRQVLGERVNTDGKKVYLVKATEDEIQVKQAALVSKAIRNSGLRLIPDFILEEAMAKVHETLSDKVKQDPDAERKKVVDQFFSVGIKASDLELYLKKPMAQATPDDLVELQEVYTSIRDGHATWSEFVSEQVNEVAKEEEVNKGKLAEIQEWLRRQRGAAGSAAPAPAPAPAPESDPTPLQEDAPAMGQADSVEALVSTYRAAIRAAGTVQEATAVFNEAMARLELTADHKADLQRAIKDRLEQLGEKRRR